MTENKAKEISRRDFLKLSAAGTLVLRAASTGPFFLFPDRQRARQKRLRILQWHHFVPGYDKWFDEVFAKEWGLKNNTQVIVDHVALEEINTRAAADVAARKGHDLTMFVSPPAAYERDAIDHSEIYQEVERKRGQVIRLGHKSTFNPKTKRYFAFADSYLPTPVHWRKDCWEQIGLPHGPDNYQSLLIGTAKIREKLGVPCGLGLAPELDTNIALQTLLWSFGGSVQDQHGNVAINSRGTIEALKYMKALYEDAGTPEVFSWEAASNDRAMLAGTVSFVANAISLTRQAEKENSELSKRIALSPALRGPAGWVASAHVVSCYVIWAFAANQQGAKQFLVDLIGQFGAAFQASEFCNFPCFPTTVPDLKIQISNDPQAEPSDKYKALVDALDWTTNLGHPGYATAASDEVFNTFVIPRMFAKVTQGDLSPEEGAAAAAAEVKRIADKWNRPLAGPTR